MSRLPPRSARGSRGAATSHPAKAGFRPAAAAIALATAFGLQSAPVRAQPAGGQAIAGQASFATSGNKLLVTTQNAPGTSHSAINWQSFSVPAGSLAQFNQPSAASTSINRVIGPNPSAIFGTLRSNGRLVLVNPAGIAVGAGAVVDTAGFTASTLSMSEADAIAGRMRFAGNGGALQVDGSIVARSGDVVLIAPNVQTGKDAVMQANGATVLAAGQKVEITGRGLEGIRLEVQAPDNQAVNLGKLQGDAVGIFAGTLRHSGVVQAMAVTTEGGKVLLKAQGDNLVSGSIAAAAADGKGGSIDVLGQRVGLLAGAALDASGAAGGGQVRVGGDYQGLNADVQNAKATYVDAQAAIKADATRSGDGGRVIVWSDDATRMHGQVSARGGAQGGDGGFVEASGKKYLEFTGRADLRAPAGKVGNLLLDPNDIEITAGGSTTTSSQSGGDFSGGSGTSTISDAVLSDQLASGNVQVATSYGSMGPLGGRITLLGGADVHWESGSTLSLNANAGIALNGAIRGAVTSTGVANGNLHLYTQSGDITQSATSSIEAASLYATAGQYSSSVAAGVNGRVLMDQSTTNKVGTLAGSAYGPNSEFRFQNASTLTIGSVETSYGGGSGVQAQDGFYAGPVAVATLNGDLNVASGYIEGSTVKLKAANGSVNLEGDSVQASTGLLDIAASANVNVGLTGGRYLYGQGGAGGGIRIAAGGDVNLGTAGSSLYSYRSPIEVSAGNSILGNGWFRSGGSVDGWIHLTAANGSIGFGGISSNGSYSGIASGEVKLMAKTGVTGGDIASYGGYGYGTNGTAGGNVHVETSAGNIAINGVNAAGGSASLGTGGKGGAVTLLARGAGGTVSVAGDIDASGGSATYGSGGAGGTITVQADGDVTLHQLIARGGDGHTDSASVPASGGAGGTVEVTSNNGNIALQTTGTSIMSGGGAMVSGGWGYSLAAGGAGGAITLSAPGTGASAGNIAVGGTLEADGGGSDTTLAADAQQGNAITVTAGKNISIYGIQFDGGNDDTSLGGAGGKAVLTSATGNIDLVYAYGSGRRGGTLAVTANGSGGNGNITIGQVDMSGRSYSLGPGGKGGAILLKAGGAVTATSSLNATGGAGDTAPGDGGSVSVVGEGKVLVNGVYAYGGYSSLGAGSGAMGGSVELISNTGDVTATGTIDVAGRPGGQVTVRANQGSISVQRVDASGLYGGGDGTAGRGGTILLQALSSTGTVSASGELTASGGATYDGAGGNGGNVTVQAGGNVTLYGASARGGNASLGSGGGGAGGAVSLVSAAGNVDVYGISASGGSGSTGGKGGTVQVQAALDLNLTDLEVFGGNGSSSAGGARGGDGGAASVKFGGSLASSGGLLLVLADGGDGGNGGSTSAGGGDGGNGGSIEVGRTGGDWTPGAMGLDAVGGTGGNAVFDSGAGGGRGGNGGSVTISASAGSLALANASMLASAGFGGLNSDDETYAGRGAGLGMVTARAAGDLSILNLDYLDIAGFTGQAGGNIDVSAPIVSHGGSITLSAGDPAAPSPNPDAALSIRAGIDSTDGLSVPGGAIKLAATGNVLVDAQPVQTEVFLASLAAAAPTPTVTVQGGPITISGPQVTIAAADSVASMESVAIRADALVVDGSVSASPSGTLSIDALTAARTIRLGGTDEAGSLNITQSELDRMEARTLVVGGTGNSGSVIVESPVSIDRARIDSLQLQTGGDLQLDGTITANAKAAPATSDVVVLAANSIHVGSGGGINLADGRWLAYIAGALDSSNFGTLVSNQYALWNRTFAGSPPGTVAETGNRYLFAFQPTITIDAISQSKVYDGTAISNAAFTATPVVDAAAYGNVFLQDAVPTINVAVANFSKNVGSYAIVQDAVTVPDGYAVVFHEGVATITKRQLDLAVGAQGKVYDATTAAQATTSVANQVAGDDLTVTVGSADFADRNVGTGKAVLIAGLGLAGADAGNYSLASTSASASADITPAPVTVAADNLAKLQGTELVFNGTEFTAAGLKGGETITSVSLASDGAPAEAPLGAYAIKASSAVGGNGFLAGNYQVSYLNGALAVISPAQQPEVNGPIATFATLFIDQVNQQNALDKKKTDFGKDDIVVTDTACKPS